MEAIYIITAIVAACITLAFIMFFRNKDDNLGFIWTLRAVVGICACIVALVLFVIGTAVTYDWVGAKYKRDIINREYGTTYTREEIFFGKDVIEAIRNLDRQRYEVNGNLMRDK